MGGRIFWMSINFLQDLYIFFLFYVFFLTKEHMDLLDSLNVFKQGTEALFQAYGLTAGILLVLY